jgi:FkbM family methyltransferase
LTYDRARRMWHRPGDRLILDEMPGAYGPVPVQPGDVLLDLGAHIGAASRYLMDKGVARTVCIEADPANIPYLRRNLAGRTATILWSAVGEKPGHTLFYTRSDRGFVGSVLADPDRKRVTVPVVPLSGLLAKYRPTIVKADIEFAEYGLPELRALPAFVRVLTMEVHIRFVGIFTGRTMDADELRQRRETATAFIEAVEASGFGRVSFHEKQVTPKQTKVEGPAAPDGSWLGPMTKAVIATWAR